MRAMFIESPSGHIGIDLVPEPNDGNEAVLMRQLARQLRVNSNRMFAGREGADPDRVDYHGIAVRRRPCALKAAGDAEDVEGLALQREDEPQHLEPDLLALQLGQLQEGAEHVVPRPG